MPTDILLKLLDVAQRALVTWLGLRSAENNELWLIAKELKEAQFLIKNRS